MRLTDNWRSSGDVKGAPGEPLFTLAEIAAKIGASATGLQALMRWHSGLVPWKTTGRGNAGMAHERRVYRLSDAKRWWWTIPVEAREKAKMK